MHVHHSYFLPKKNTDNARTPQLFIMVMKQKYTYNSTVIYRDIKIKAMHVDHCY